MNKIKEKANIPAAAVENFFNPEMKRVMESLRKSDDNIRTILVGQKVGNADIDTPEDNKPIKELIKSARTNFNRKEYMSGIADIGRFHKRMYEVSKYIEKLSLDVNSIHNSFLFKGLSDKEKKHLQNLQQHMSTASINENDSFIKEAGIMDFFYNIGTKRGRALSMWEKKYPNVAKDIREGGHRVLDLAETAWANTLSHLKEMASFRATRSVDNYMESAHKIQSEYNRFDNGKNGFRGYYNNVVQPWLKKFEQWEAERSDERNKEDSQRIQALEKHEIPSSLTSEKDRSDYVNQRNKLLNQQSFNPIEPDGRQVPASPWINPQIPKSPQVPNIPVPAAALSGPPGDHYDTVPVSPPTMSSSPPSEAPKGEEFKSDQLLKEFYQKKSHKKFLQSLEKMSNEHPRILAGFISKYAQSVEASDPETAIELFLIVNKLKK